MLKFGDFVSDTKHLLSVYFAVLLFGVAAPLVDANQLDASVIAFGRLFISTIILLIFIILKSRMHTSSRPRPSIIGKLNLKTMCLLFFTGFSFATHTLTFILSINLSGVAIAMTLFMTYPVFVFFLEPLISKIFFKESKKQLNYKSVIISMTLSFLVVAGVFVSYIGFEAETQIWGIVCGVVSGLTYAIKVILKHRLVSQNEGSKESTVKKPPEVIIFFEHGIAAVLLLIPIPFLTENSLVWTVQDIRLLAILGLVTALANFSYVFGLQRVEPRYASIISGMEVLFAITISSIIARELPSISQIIGSAMVLISAIVITLYRIKALPSQKSDNLSICIKDVPEYKKRNIKDDIVIEIIKRR